MDDWERWGITAWAYLGLYFWARFTLQDIPIALVCILLSFYCFWRATE